MAGIAVFSDRCTAWSSTPSDRFPKASTRDAELGTRASCARQDQWRFRFARDSAAEGDGFELPVPRRKSRGFPQHSEHSGGIGGALKRYHLMVQPFFFCASNHSIEPGWGTF